MSSTRRFQNSIKLLHPLVMSEFAQPISAVGFRLHALHASMGISDERDPAVHLLASSSLSDPFPPGRLNRKTHERRRRAGQGEEL